MRMLNVLEQAPFERVLPIVIRVDLIADGDQWG